MSVRPWRRAGAALFTPTARLAAALRGFFHRRGHAPYPEGGVALTVTAWALGLSLGGPVRDVEGHALARRWIGPEAASARLNRSALRRVLYLSLMAHILLFACLVFALFVREAAIP